MALASFVFRLREVIFDGPSKAEEVALANGNTTITKPTGADGAVVFPDPNSTATLILKGVAGDTGITQVAKCPFIVTVAGASFVINSNAATQCAVRWFRLQ